MPSTKTIEVTTYKYSELTGKAKEKAEEKLSEWITDYDWWENVYEMWQGKLCNRGYQGCDIGFSGFGSQGDGASFSAKFVALDDWLKFDNLEEKYAGILSAYRDGECAIHILRRGNYSHEMTMYTSTENYYLSEELEEGFEGLEKLVLLDARE